MTGAPAGGPVTLHNGSYGVDLNGDGSADFTITDSPSLNSDGSVLGSAQEIWPEIGAGIYLYPQETGGYAAALGSGQQVGPLGSGGYIYGVQGLATVAIIHGTNLYYANGIGDPAWTDGSHRFIGTDLVYASDHHFGWIELSLANSGAPTTDQPWYDVTIYGWAYETAANVPTTIPEPSPDAIVAVAGVAATVIRTRQGAERGTAPLQGRKA